MEVELTVVVEAASTGALSGAASAHTGGWLAADGAGGTLLGLSSTLSDSSGVVAMPCATGIPSSFT